MLIPISSDHSEDKWLDEVENREELERAWADMLKNANTGMMSWAEKNFRMKLIDNLYHMRYYKFNQTIYLNTRKGQKENE